MGQDVRIERASHPSWSVEAGRRGRTAVRALATIDTCRPEDECQITAMYRRVFGADATEGNRLRWNWQ